MCMKKYFVSYRAITYGEETNAFGRCEITRKNKIESITDIEGIESFIVQNNPEIKQAVVLYYKLLLTFN